MPEITAKDVMNLRNRTGLPMMDCKQALEATSGNVEAAEEWLRKKLKGKMEKRTDRAAGEGRIEVATNTAAGTGAIVELRAETDFTARNERFVQAARRIATLALEAPSGAVRATPAMTTIIDDLRAATGENISFARGQKVAGETGTTAFGTYVHHDGKTGVLLQAEGSIAEETLREICMHIVGTPKPPIAVSDKDVPADIADKERRFREEQAKGKPPEIAAKIVEGAMRSFFAEITLLEQPFIKDESRRIRDIVGPKATIIGFYRWQLGGGQA